MKTTQPLLKGITRKLRLTTKQTNKGYYKGTGTGNTGSHTKWGGFMVDYRKVRTYVVPPPPEDSNYILTPFIDNHLDPIAGSFQAYKGGAFSGERYLDKYKEYQMQAKEEARAEAFRQSEERAAMRQDEAEYERWAHEQEGEEEEERK